MKMELSFKKAFLTTLIISLVASALLGIAAILFSSSLYDDFMIEILLTTLAVAFYSLTGLCCAALYEKENRKTFATLGMTITILGFLFAIPTIWGFVNLDYWENIKPSLIFIILAFGFAQTSLLLQIQSKKALINISLALTIIFIFVVMGMLSTLVITELDIADEDLFIKALMIFAIFDALGTIVTPILHKVYMK